MMSLSSRFSGGKITTTFLYDALSPSARARLRRRARRSRSAAFFQEQPHWAKAAPIDFAHAVPPQRPKVRARRISLVLVEAVLGEAQMQPAHFRVALGLGENRRRGDHLHPGVAIHDRADWERKFGAMRSVEQNFMGWDRQGFHGAPHGEEARAQDVQPVDFLDA